MTTIDRSEVVEPTSPTSATHPGAAPHHDEPAAGSRHGDRVGVRDRIGAAVRVRRRLADRRVLVAAGVVAAALATVLFATSGRSSLAAVAAACGAPAPDTRATTSAADVAAFLQGCGDAGRAAYRDLQLVDLVYPAALGLFLASALALLLPRVRPGRALGRGADLLPLLPLVAAGADYVENLCAWWLLATWPEVPTVPAHLLGVASATKQVTSWASGLLVVGLLAIVGVRRLWARPPSVTAGRRS